MSLETSCVFCRLRVEEGHAFVWRGVRDVRGLRGVRDPRICFLPRMSHKVCECRRERAVSFVDFVWRGVCLRVEGEAVAGASNAAGRAGRGGDWGVERGGAGQRK